MSTYWHRRGGDVTSYLLLDMDEPTTLRIVDEGRRRHCWVLYDGDQQITGSGAIGEAKEIGDAVWEVKTCEARLNHLQRKGAPEGDLYRAGNALESARRELAALCPTGPTHRVLF